MIGVIHIEVATALPLNLATYRAHPEALAIPLINPQILVHGFLVIKTVKGYLGFSVIVFLVWLIVECLHHSSCPTATRAQDLKTEEKKSTDHQLQTRNEALIADSLVRRVVEFLGVLIHPNCNPFGIWKQGLAGQENSL